MRRGFTLLEMIVVIIVLGILASFAIPQFIKATEKAKVGEALGILPAVEGSQVRYAMEHDGVLSGNCSNLDITIPAPKYFNLTCASGNSTGTAGVASMQRKVPAGGYGTYSLCIRENGTVECSGGNTNDCLNLGQNVNGTCQ